MKVILVGGGPVGLVAAHMFHRAGIDFILVERSKSIVPDGGAGIVLFPHNIRVMDQLGVGRKLRESVGIRINVNRIITRAGKVYNTLHTSKWTVENHGESWLMLHRPDLMRVLYDHLHVEAKACILTGAEAKDVVIESDGVQVRCTLANGTDLVLHGDIVVGADGVHSRIRDCMRRLTLDKSPAAPLNPEKPFVSTYRAMFGVTNPIPGIVSGEEWDMHTAGGTVQCFTGEGKCWFIIYQKLPRPTYETKRYTQADQDGLVAEMGDVHVTPTLRLKDIYDAREWCHLTDLHEGAVDVFHAFGRIVLVGDTINKQTPNAGQGWNCGLQDIVVLTNLLHELNEGKGGDMIKTEDFGAVFEKYQQTRERDLKTFLALAAATTRMQAWDTWKDWWMDRIHFPWTKGNEALYSRVFGPLIAKSHVLDFIPEENQLVGKHAWVHSPKVDGRGVLKAKL